MHLLAKSNPQLDLLQHLADVLESAQLLFGRAEPTWLGTCWMRFFRCRDYRRFQRSLEVASIMHDVGKANHGFQAMVRGKGEQGIRHEHLSSVLMHADNWRPLLESIPDCDADLALAAVLTHHLKCANEKSIDLINQQRIVKVCLDEAACHKISDLLGVLLEAPKSHWTVDDVEKSAAQIGDKMHQLKKALRKDASRLNLLRALRSALICADAAASGLRRTGLSLQAWICAQFPTHAALSADYINREIIQKRIAQTPGFKWHTFQENAASQPDRTLLLAPCGAGKTLAAWRWIDQQMRVHGASRAIFLYPTRATATEGFRGYASWAPDADASLLHGTSDYELDGMFEELPEDGRSSGNYQTDPRLYAVGFWSKRAFSATVDQFMAFLHHAYGPTCLLPVLADAIVVIDEVHAFDPAMFTTLKRFLQEFDVPVLCMTATLLEHQRRQLTSQCKLHCYAEKPDRLADIANAPRYRVTRTRDKDLECKVLTSVSNGKRVLWVVNQVPRAQSIAQRLTHLLSNFSVEVLCYHSRFTLDDRKRRHHDVVRSFAVGAADQGALAITTQVCEMSLDLDADVLVTELCPCTSLVQRMGRCNRKNHVPESLGEVLIYDPDGERPYDKSELEAAGRMADELADRKIASQSALEDVMKKYGRPAPQDDRYVPFVSATPFADSSNDPFRDIEDSCVSGIFDENAYAEARKEVRPGMIVPVPRKLRPQRCTRSEARHLYLAPIEQYSARYGLLDAIQD